MAEENGDKPNPREVFLSDGSRLVINLNALHWKEVREYVAGVPTFDPAKPDASDKAERRHAELKGRMCGKTADEILALGFEDFSRLSKKITDLIINPVDADPN